MERVISFLGLFFMVCVAWVFSNNKKKMDFRIIFGGILIQFLLALFILKTNLGILIFQSAQLMVEKIISMSDEGARFVFGDKFTDHFFAFKVLPTIIFVSALSSLLFYWGIMQRVVQALAWVMNKIMNISGSESLAAAANIFCGQTEAPLIIKPYIATMTKSEIMCMMTSGMATVSGGVLAAYVGLGISAGHLLSASFMSAPAAIVIAKIMFPETQKSLTKGKVNIGIKLKDENMFAAICNGAASGLKLALNVAAMLIAFIAIVALLNVVISYIASLFGLDLNFQKILGIIFQPIAFIMGVPWHDCLNVGQLLGEKTVLNEFIAYMHLGDMIKAGQLSNRSVVIVTYALCGFANFASIGIQIGGIGGLEPKRKSDFAKLGFLSMVGGTLAAFMTACIAGMLI